jgi:hypothetical protein
MKRLLALLLLVVSPAFAQQYTPGPYIPASPPTGETENLIYTTLNPPPEGTQFTWTGFINSTTNGGGLSGGNVPAYNGQTGTFIFGYAQGTVTYNLFDSPEFPNAGTLIDSFKYSWEYFNQDFSRGTLSASIKFYDPNNNILNDYNFQLPKTTNGWTLFGGEIGFADPYDISEIGRIQISFTGKDDRFWAGYYGPQVRGLDLSLLYSVPPPPTDFLYWERLAGENELFTLTEPGVVRYGANGIYIYQEFQAGTYACTNGDWGSDPIGGVVKSCDFGSNISPPVAEVDCATNPADPTCIIDSLVDNGVIDPVEQAIADATDTTDEETGSDDGSSDGTEVVEEEEEVLVADDATEETDLEEMLQNDVFDEEEEEVLIADNATETVVERTMEPTTTSVAALVDDSKANELADSISKNVLEGALAIAAENTAAGSAVAASSASDSSSKTASTSVASSSATASAETVAIEIKNEETKQETNESSVAAADVLETGRQMGVTALAATQSASEASATESIAQAESVAATSSESQTMIASNIETQSTTIITEESRQNISERTESESIEIRTESSASVTEVTMETDASNLVAETVTAIEENTNENVVVANAEITESTDTFADIMQLEIKPTEEKIDADLEFVQQVVASSNEQKQEEMSNSTFSEEEKITIANDPALANAFNLSPNVTNLEVAGVLNNKQEEKSDAEKRADEVVAANAKEQEEINKNYMDADQSGIVAAMGADTDVSAYRTAMLNDNNIWYKPEDIYKNIVIKDNVRGSYFLEKGNTDTYKKMVEEQYK